ncbi:hypothetical protein GCM10011332_05800 [Terasakiella brassicae]|uniref:Uncharacterized protein n=1 Tax=Terasakiella brassicae TaxID=1634917 RepID=A0A917F7U8_9PROT|nr:hypothetical protein [Terasakiella brassicae]GGF55251.1 hypothetical protein GCM10011332_05800 [Terasakiella brassicae]
MKSRKLGAELELFLTKDDIPATPKDWAIIVNRAVSAGYSAITEPYNGLALGASGKNGWFILDNNCAIVELVSLPFCDLDATIDNLENLLAFFESITPEYRLHWVSQYAPPNEDEYWNRTVSTGLYSIVRHQNWGHWHLMNSLAFQPAIDISTPEIPAVLRTLYLTAPLFVHLYGGHDIKNTPRLQNWLHAIPYSAQRTGLPTREINSLDDYVANLLDLPAFIVSNSVKNGELAFFDTQNGRPRVSDVVFNGATAFRVHHIPTTSQMRTDKIGYDKTYVNGSLANFYALSLPFWHCRLVFDAGVGTIDGDVGKITRAIEKSDKLYVELRHIGTPQNMMELRKIYQVFVNLVERAQEINQTISPLISWQEAQDENRLAVQNGALGDKSKLVFDTLKELGLFQKEETI